MTAAIKRRSFVLHSFIKQHFDTFEYLVDTCFRSIATSKLLISMMRKRDRQHLYLGYKMLRSKHSSIDCCRTADLIKLDQSVVNGDSRPPYIEVMGVGLSHVKVYWPILGRKQCNTSPCGEHCS